MTERRGGQWSSPEKQQDEKYQRTMHEYFGPGNGPAAVRRPLDDDTAVIPPVRNGAGRSAADGEPGAAAASAPAAEQGLGLKRVVLFALVAVGAFLLIGLLAWLLFGGDGDASGAGEAERAPVAAGAQAPPVEDTGLIFEAADGEGDAYAIRMGEYEWEGTEAMNGDVEEVVVEGRTAAHFTTAVRLADGTIQTGVFGRAPAGKPLWHATYQRTTSDSEQATTGTYQVIDDQEVILEGAYTDRVVEDNPGDEPDEIVREYVEGDPRKGEADVERFRASFRAAEGVEIPWLPGNPVAAGSEEGS